MYRFSHFCLLDDDDNPDVTLATVDVVLVATLRSLSSGLVTLVVVLEVIDLALQFYQTF